MSRFRVPDVGTGNCELKCPKMKRVPGKPYFQKILIENRIGLKQNYRLKVTMDGRREIICMCFVRKECQLEVDILGYRKPVDRKISVIWSQ